jgi:hypothetical protein
VVLPYDFANAAPRGGPSPCRSAERGERQHRPDRQGTVRARSPGSAAGPTGTRRRALSDAGGGRRGAIRSPPGTSARPRARPPRVELRARFSTIPAS